MPARFSPAQIDQISRTVRHTPEVMVKVTGGGTRRGAVAAHFAYISRRGTLEIETDEGERIGRREEHKRLLDDWHLELTAGQYRRQRGRSGATADEARSQHRAFHAKADAPRQGSWPPRGNSPARNSRNTATPWSCTPTRQHPHVHLVVKAESDFGRRLHIDKQLLRDWREHFAQLMREQGIAANATPRAIRGKNKKNHREKGSSRRSATASPSPP